MRPPTCPLPRAPDARAAGPQARAGALAARSRACVAAVARARPASCCCVWTPMRWARLPRACPRAASSSQLLTARPPRPRSPQASSARRASGWCTTVREQIWLAASPPPCSTPRVPGAQSPGTSDCSRSMSTGSASLSGSCARARSCSATSSVISSTAMESSRASPNAGRGRSAPSRRVPRSSYSTPTIPWSPISGGRAGTPPSARTPPAARTRRPLLRRR